jgi:hypothetical protein
VPPTAARADRQVKPNMIGRRIGRYHITEELGRGGMGIVYRATQVTLNRTVALKLLFPHLAASREYLGRFQREAVTLARVQHDNIVHIYDVEEFEGSSAIVMEYVGGPSLSRVLAKEGRMAPALVRDIAVALCGALESAHRQGIIHRDIKPDNILFSSDGRPKLTDFGIAHMRDDHVHTRTGIMLGTPYYMSPEQARGRTVSGASDLYSLGVVMYEMLTGSVPFSAEDSLAVALQHVQDPPPPVQQRAPWVPPSLAALVHRTLEKDPAQRFGTARELGEALNRLGLADSPTTGTWKVVTPGASACPECDAVIRDDFLTCPSCGLSIRQRCDECTRLYDPLSPECPFCRTPARPTPTPVRAVGASAVAPAVPAAAATSSVVPRPGATAATAMPTASAPAAASSGPATAAGPAAVVPAGSTQASPVGPLSDPAEAPPTPLRVLWAAVAADASAGFARMGRGRAGAAATRFSARMRSQAPGMDARAALLAVGRQALDARIAGMPLLLWVGAALTATALLGMMSVRQGGTPGNPAGPGESGFAPSAAPGGSAVFGRPGNPVRPGSIRREPTAEERDRANAALENLLLPPQPADSTAADSAAAPAARDPGTDRRQTPAADAGADRREPAQTERQPAREDPTPNRTGFDEAAAANAIRGIVDRQRRATVENNIELLLRDVAPELHAELRRSFQDMHATARDIASRITNVDIEFDDEQHASVTFHARITAVRRRDNRSVVIHDGPVEWLLERRGQQWLIVAAGE